MDKTCEHCSAPFTPIRSDRPSRFCSRQCYFDHIHEHGRGQLKEAVHHRMRRASGHPVAPPSGIVAIARIVLYDKIGSGPHPCHWCGATLRWTHERKEDTLFVDHLDHDPANDAASNLAPSCNNCNGHRTRKGDRNLIASDEPTVLRNGRPTRAIPKRCARCHEPFLALPADIPKGKGRFCSRSCARQFQWHGPL